MSPNISLVAVDLSPVTLELGVFHNETHYYSHLQKSIFAVAWPSPIKPNAEQGLVFHQAEIDVKVRYKSVYLLNSAE